MDVLKQMNKTKFETDVKIHSVFEAIIIHDAFYE